MALGSPNLASLVTNVSAEVSCDAALDRLTESALLFTGSRNAMIARVNEESGTMELRHGSGRDWTLKAYGERIQVGERSGEGIVAHVAATGRSVVSGDVQADPRYRRMFDSRSEIAVPICDRYARIRAVLNVESDQPHHYNDEHLKLCETIAALAGLAIEREDLQRREEALLQIGTALGSAQTADELINSVLSVAGEVLRFQSCSIFLFDERSEKFVLRGSVGPLSGEVGALSYAAGEGCTGWVCETGKPLLLDSPQSDPRWAGKHLEIPASQIASYLAVPIGHRRRCIGAIRVIRRVSDNPYIYNRFTEDDQRLLQAIADQLATGLENIGSFETALRVERMAAWGELSAKSSHMIGNRVFALKGDVNELGHLLNDPQLDPEQLQALQASLVTNVTRLEEILQDFRDFVTATQVSLVQADVNFIVRESVLEVFPRRSPIKLEFELGPDLPFVLVDARKLRRAIAELIENSLNFFTEGRLRVATYLAPKAIVRRAKLNMGRAYVCVEIEDQGPGIKSDQKSLIFRPFYSSRVRGMGLGLSIVKGIVDAHEGTVMEVGKEGKGAKFVILLPAHDRAASE